MVEMLAFDNSYARLPDRFYARVDVGPGVREDRVREAMAARDIPPARARAVATAGEEVVGDESQPWAVLPRADASQLRVHAYDYVAARDDREALVGLAAHGL